MNIIGGTQFEKLILSKGLRLSLIVLMSGLLAGAILALVPISAVAITIEDISPSTENYPYNHAWENSVSGRMQALTVAPSDESRLYAGGYSGIWRSDNGGKNWKQLTRPQPSQGVNDVPGNLSVSNILDIAVSPANKDLVLVAAIKDDRINKLDGIYRSRDGGETWSLVHQFDCGYGKIVGQIVFAPDDPNLVFAAGDCKIGKSIDGGANWDEKTIEGHAWSIAVAPQEGAMRRIYAVGNGKMSYSQDGGETWYTDKSLLPKIAGDTFNNREALSHSARILAVEPGHNDHVYLVVRNPATGPSFYHHPNEGPDGSLNNNPIAYDSNSNNIYDKGEQIPLKLIVNEYGDPELALSIGEPLKHDSKIKYVDANNNGIWDPGETLIYDVNNNGKYDINDPGKTSEIIIKYYLDKNIIGTEPNDGTELKDDPKIMYVDRGFPYGTRDGGGGTLWIGDYSGFNIDNPEQRYAKWEHLPGTSGIFGDTTTSGNAYVLVKPIQGSSNYLVFMSDRGHVFVSLGRPTQYKSWHRITGNDISQTYGVGSELYVHVDPHSIAVSNDINFTLKPASGVPFPYDQNSVLDAFYSGTIWMANDGGVYYSTDGGVNGDQSWHLGKGLATIAPYNVAGVAISGGSPALYMGTYDNDDFYSLDGGATWGNPYSGCGDCDTWFADQAQPSRVLALFPREFDDKGGFGLFINSTGGYPDAGDGNQRKLIPYPSKSRPGSGEFANGYRPVIQTLINEKPLDDGDYILINDTKLLRTTEISKIANPSDWNTKGTQQGPILPPNVNVVQASGGHGSPVFYVGDYSGLWKWMNGMSSWQQIVPGGPADKSATTARRFFVNPYNPDLIYIADWNGIKSSSDGGTTWQIDNLDKVATEDHAFKVDGSIRDMVFDRKEPKTRFAVGDTGIFYTLDGENWNRLLSTTAMPGHPVSAYFDPISDPNKRSLYVAFDGRGILKFCCIPVAGNISGMKFNDSNGNGIKDSGEEGLPGWEINLKKSNGDTISKMTDSKGNYIFEYLEPGKYTVEEVLKTGWKQTAPLEKIYTITLSSGESIKDKNFGNIKLGEIHGVKFEDINGNGIKDIGEPNLSDWEIKLTLPNGSIVTTMTNSNGNYSFMNLEDGSYVVGESIKSGYIQTAPAVSKTGSATYNVDIKGGNKVVDKDFGNFKLGEIHGIKWEDLNANHIKDYFEVGLPEWEINIKGKDTITGDEINITKVTDIKGNYSFMNLTTGTYVISEKLIKDDWIQTTPLTGNYTVTINSSGTIITGQDFGNFHKGKISGGGWIPAPGDLNATYGLEGQYPDSSNKAQGNMEYQDHALKLNIKSIKINTVATTIDKKRGVITGIAQMNGSGSYPFEVYVEDNAEPGGGVDVFKIFLPTYPYSNGAILSSGNIQIHK